MTKKVAIPSLSATFELRREQLCLVLQSGSERGRGLRAGPGQGRGEDEDKYNFPSSEQFMKGTMAHNTCNAIGEVSCTETDFCLSDCLVPSKVPVKAGPSKTVSFSHAFMRASLQTIR